MIINAYVIFDTKAEIYNKPFYFLNDKIALRAAQDLIDDPQTDVHKHPEDFMMFHIGTYEDETAHFKANDKQKCICRFHELEVKTTENPFPTPEITTTTVSEPPVKLKEA